MSLVNNELPIFVYSVKQGLFRVLLTVWFDSKLLNSSNVWCWMDWAQSIVLAGCVSTVHALLLLPIYNDIFGSNWQRYSLSECLQSDMHTSQMFMWGGGGIRAAQNLKFAYSSSWIIRPAKSTKFKGSIAHNMCQDFRTYSVKWISDRNILIWDGFILSQISSNYYCMYIEALSKKGGKPKWEVRFV